MHVFLHAISQGGPSARQCYHARGHHKLDRKALPLTRLLLPTAEITMKKPEQSFLLGSRTWEATVLGKTNLMMMVLSINLFSDITNKFYCWNNI